MTRDLGSISLVCGFVGRVIISFARGGFSMSGAHFRPGQKSPLQRFVLAVIFSQREGRDGFRHFVAQIKCVRGIQGPEFLEQLEGIGALAMAIAVDNV